MSYLDSILCAEQAVLAQLITDPDFFFDFESFSPEDFEFDHACIAEAIVALRKAGKVPDAISINHMLADDPAYIGLGEGVGGLQYIESILPMAFGKDAVGQYVLMMKDNVARRHAKAAMEGLNAAMADGKTWITDAIAEAMRVLSNASYSAQADPHKRMGENLEEYLDEVWSGRGERPISTGWRELDEMFSGGLLPGGVTVVAGRPGQGKSAVGLALARNVAMQGRGVMYVSIEMSYGEMVNRLISDIAYDTHGSAAPQYKMVNRPELRQEKKIMAIEAARRIKGLPIDMMVLARPTTQSISSAAMRRMAAWDREGIKPGLIIIDHIGLMQFENPRANRVEGITQITADLKALAMSANIHVVELCQLNRQVENRDKDDRRPQLSDLRDSGSIEQDADNVIGLYRPLYYHEQKRPMNASEHDPSVMDWHNEKARIENLLYVSVLKQRQGETGMVNMHVSMGHNAIRDAAKA